MPLIDGKYRRPQLRNRNINYRSGWFFVTFQVHENKSRFGAIVGEECVLNGLGLAVKRLIETLPDYNPEVYVDAFTVMPNHVHMLVKIENRETNDDNHLAKIMRKLKSLAAKEAREARGDALAPRGKDSRLWQPNYWEKIVTNYNQLAAIRRYIRDNPKHWSTDRFGPVTSHAVGNIELLQEPLVAFVASQSHEATATPPVLWVRGARGDALAPQENTSASTEECIASHGPALSGRKGDTLAPQENTSASTEECIASHGPALSGRKGVAPRLPVISTFTSPQEREVLSRIIAAKRRFIAVYPGGLPSILPRAIAKAVDDGLALLLSPVDAGTGINKQRAIWCNEFVIRRATEVWCGYINPNGTLHSILKALSFAPQSRASSL